VLLAPGRTRGRIPPYRTKRISYSISFLSRVKKITAGKEREKSGCGVPVDAKGAEDPLKEGDSALVPRGEKHRYKEIQEHPAP